MNFKLERVYSLKTLASYVSLIQLEYRNLTELNRVFWRSQIKAG